MNGKASHLIINGFLVAAGCAGFSSVFADSVLANQFAQQAGVIAGTTQACGTAITDYNSRVLEGINALSKTPEDSQAAMVVYMETLSKSLDLQSKNHVMNCAQVVQAFYSLPIMRSDYKTSVLPQMASMLTSSNNTAASSVAQVPTATTGISSTAQPAAAAASTVTGAK